MLNIQKLKFHSRQRGLSLVESMIALLVISIGLLGIAALQITSMKQNNSALHHSQAVWAGFDIAERIRANFGEFAGYDGIDTDTGYSQDCSSGCSSAQLIDSDAADWTTEVQNLPGGHGIIDSPFANQIRIKVMWDDEGSGVTGTGCTSAASDLTCYVVTLEQ
jgi:type IV pilus assembly protein PilV